MRAVQMQIIYRNAAQAAGLKLYYTGAACKRGHIAERRVVDWRCTECAREDARAAYRKNKGDLVPLTIDVRPEHIDLIKQIVADLNK